MMESPYRKATAIGKAMCTATQKSISKEREGTSTEGLSTAGKADRQQENDDHRSQSLQLAKWSNSIPVRPSTWNTMYALVILTIRCAIFDCC